MTKQTHLFTTIGIGVAATALAALAGCTRPSVPAAGCRVTRRARPRPGGGPGGPRHGGHQRHDDQLQAAVRDRLHGQPDPGQGHRPGGLDRL